MPIRSSRGIVFDLDGTLLDSVGLYVTVIHSVWEQVGLPCPDRTDIVKIMSTGRPVWQFWDRLVPPEAQSDPDLMSRCRALAVEVWTNVFKNGVQAIPGALDTVRDIKRVGLRTGLVTSNWDIESFAPFRDNPGILSEIFDAIVTGRDVKETKPSPEPILKCLSMVGLSPAVCTYVGDAPLDIVAGKVSGTWSVAVLTGAGTVESLRRENPDLILSDVSGLREYFCP